MICHSAEPQYDSRVLNGVVIRIKKLHPDAADIGKRGVTQHLLEPILRDHLGVTVQQAKKLTVCFRSAQVIQFGIVERPRVV